MFSSSQIKILIISPNRFYHKQPHCTTPNAIAGEKAACGRPAAPSSKKIFKKTVTFSIFADYIYRTFNKSKICIFVRFICTFAFAVFRSGVLRYNFCARQTSAPPFSRIVYLIWQPRLSTPIKVQRQGDILCRCAPFRDTRINIRAGKERQRFADNLICKKQNGWHDNCFAV